MTDIKIPDNVSTVDINDNCICYIVHDDLVLLHLETKKTISFNIARRRLPNDILKYTESFLTDNDAKKFERDNRYSYTLLLYSELIVVIIDEYIHIFSYDDNSIVPTYKNKIMDTEWLPNLRKCPYGNPTFMYEGIQNRQEYYFVDVKQDGFRVYKFSSIGEPQFTPERYKIVVASRWRKDINAIHYHNILSEEQELLCYGYQPIYINNHFNTSLYRPLANDGSRSLRINLNDKLFIDDYVINGDDILFTTSGGYMCVKNQVNNYVLDQNYTEYIFFSSDKEHVLFKINHKSSRVVLGGDKYFLLILKNSQSLDCEIYTFDWLFS